MTNTDIDADLRREAIDGFVAATGAPPFERLVQRGRERDSATYVMELTDGRHIKLGGIDRLWSQAELSKTLAVVTNKVLKRLKTGDWQDMMALLIGAATDVDERPEETRAAQIREWIDMYLPATPNVDRDQAATKRLPFLEDDRLHIHPQELAQFIRRELGEIVSLADVRGMLVDAGYEPLKIGFNRNGERARRTTAIYYTVSAQGGAEAGE